MKQTLEEAAIEAVENHYGMDYDGKIHEMYILREAFEAGAQWQEKQSPWISVEEWLPEPDQLVLCRMVSNGAIVSGFIDPIPGCQPQVSTLPDFEFEDYCDYVCDTWMPIPSFDEILEANKDVLERIKEKGD